VARLVLLALVVSAGCASRSPCERFAELSATCEGESLEVSRSICANAFEHMGEKASVAADRERARGLARVNATLRLQAQCAAKADDCEAFAQCTELRAHQPYGVTGSAAR
jgi:hypothetical protein